MSFFTSRKRADPGKSAEKRAEGKGKLVRSEFIPRRRLADNDLAGHVCSVTQQVAANSLREIDDLIVVLQLRREKLLDESARVQCEIIEYAKLSQSTMQSVQIITESISHLNKVPVRTPPAVASAASKRFPTRSTATAEARHLHKTVRAVKLA